MKTLSQTTLSAGRFGKLLLLITGLLFYSQFTVKAQVIRQSKARIENIDFYLVDENIKILYNIVNGKDWEIFDIAVSIYNAADTSLIEARTFTGDITAIKPGKGNAHLKQRAKFCFGTYCCSF